MSGASKSSRALRLLGVERLVLLFGALAVFLYLFLDIPFRSPGGLYLVRIREAALLYGIGLILALFALRLSDIRAGRRNGAPIDREKTLTRFKGRYLLLPRLATDLRILHAIALTFVIFIHLKHLIPSIRSTVYDGTLAAIERSAFGGLTATERLQQLLGTHVAPTLSTGYTLFYPYLAFICVVGVLEREQKAAERFAACFAATWLFGILLVYLVPTLGPCFAYPETVAGLPFTDVTLMQQDLWKNKLHLDVFPRSPEGVFLIAGFPSLHFAIPLLGTAFLYRRHPLLCALSAVFSFVTLITTLYFGWHYVVDDVGSIVLVMAVLAATHVRPSGR